MNNSFKIICVHLLDDLSGSPRILASVVAGLRQAGLPVQVLTSRQKTGFLQNTGVPTAFFNYTFYENKLRRLLELMRAQWAIFAYLWQFRRQDVVIYVNTLLPFGAALAGWLMRKKVVYHLHEATVNPAPLRWLTVGVARLTAWRCIYVSTFLKNEIAAGTAENSVVVPNGLSRDFWEKACEGYALRPSVFARPAQQKPNVLMICSLKNYKGVPEFVRLARAMPDCNFQLVLNAEWSEIRAFFGGENLPENLVIFPRQSDVGQFYREADVALNLSRPDGWIESFGMTLLEAMAYGVPVIAPTVGGPTEFVRHGENGFLTDSSDTELLAQHIRTLTDEPSVWQSFSENARQTAAGMLAEDMQRGVCGVLGEIYASPEVNAPATASATTLEFTVNQTF